MSLLSEYPLELEDMPFKLSPIAGRISTKMSKAEKTPKPAYAKTRGEHFKDNVIVALIVGIVAFTGGMTFQGKQHEAIETAVKGAQVVAPAETPVKK